MYLVDMDPLLRVWGHGGLHRPCMLIGSSAHLSAKEASELIPQPVNLKPETLPATVAGSPPQTRGGQTGIREAGQTVTRSKQAHAVDPHCKEASME